MFGKLTFLCAIAVLLSFLIYWVVNRSQGTDVTATTSANGPVEVDTEFNSAAAPKLRDVAFWGVNGSGVTISWSTDLPSNSSVVYGTTEALDQVTPVDPKLSNSHGAVLKGLKGGTKYYFAAQSADAAGNVGRSAVYSFTTKVTAPPTISAIVVKPGANHHADISWTTSVPANSYVQYGITTAYGTYSKRTDLTTHPQPEMSWVSSGVIHYQLVSTDALGNKAVSPDYTFVEP